MRLVCPNCNARYEIEASLIPSEGRDVQCSSCGETWWQPPPDAAQGEHSPTEAAGGAETLSFPETGMAPADPQSGSAGDPDRPRAAIEASEGATVPAGSDSPEAPGRPTDPAAVGATPDGRDLHASTGGQDHDPVDEGGRSAERSPAEAPGLSGSALSWFGRDLGGSAPPPADAGPPLLDEENPAPARGDATSRDVGRTESRRHDPGAPWAPPEGGSGVGRSAEGSGDRAAGAPERAAHPTAGLHDGGRSERPAETGDADDEEMPVGPGRPEGETPVGPDRPDPVRPPIDPSVLGILRAEAEREIAARRAERAALEQQGAFGLAEAGRPQLAAAAVGPFPSDRMTGPDLGSRSAVLPDIVALNSTLTATGDREHPPSGVPRDEVVRRQRSGFRLGFSLILIAALALIVLYLLAPALGQAVPALHPALADYVDRANAMRLALDRVLGGALADLRALAGRG